MSKFNAGQSFADGDTVTGAKLNNIAGLLDIYTGLISEQTAMAATVSTADQLLIADVDNGDSGAANRVTVQKLLNDTLTNGTYTNAQLSGNLNVTQLSTLGTLNNTRGTVGILNSTTGTIQSLTSSTANISQGSAIFTQGTIGTLNTTTGTIGTLNTTTGTIGTLNNTTGTIANLSATTSTFLGTITGSTNIVNIGSGQLYKDASGNVGIGKTPTNKLDIFAASNTGITISNGTMTAIFANSADTSIAIGTQTTHPINFYINNSPVAILNTSGNLGIGSLSPVNKLEITGSFGRGAPVTKTADFSLADTENWLIVNKAAATCTVTLPAASSWTGREFTIKTLQAFTVVSASSNVVPRNGAAAGTAILAAVAGNWATLVSNGTAWVIMCGS